MTTCPLCSERVGKRYCPAKETQICSVCCGTKREIEIDCPSTCVYLKSSRIYDADKRVPDAEIAARAQKYDDEFVQRYSPVLSTLAMVVVEERSNSPWLVDNDVIEVYKALNTTMKTLSSGIYYETVPEGAVRVALFKGLKSALDEMMQPNPHSNVPTLKVSEAVDVLDFLLIAAEGNASIRPKSRRYLELLSQLAGPARPSDRSSGLILP